MKVIYSIGKVNNPSKRVVLVIGVFDGVHLGHQKLILRAVRRAKKLNVDCVVMTFSPHPVHVLYPQTFLPYVCSLEQRLHFIEKLGVDGCLVVHFTKRFSRLSPEGFIKRYLVEHVRPCEVFVGDDFRFGHNRQGGNEYFVEVGKRYGFDVNIVHSVKDHQKKIGSSRIRQMVMEGKLKEAAHLLGRSFFLEGIVIQGDSRGKKLGFPTANLAVEPNTLLPLGVFAVIVQIDKKIHCGMANVGLRPSFTSGRNNPLVEVHIFDFQKNLYGKKIGLEFIAKVRDEKVFESAQDLVEQLRKDEKYVKNIFRKK